MIEHWIINTLVMSIPILIWFCRDLWKDNKKKQEIIKLQENILKKHNLI